MDLQTAQRLVGIERRLDGLKTPEGSYDLISPYLALPGLRGFWPMSSFNESGNAYDMSEQGRILTYNGNPTYNYTGLAPYIDLDGVGDYLSRADEAGLDIIGTESYVAAAVRGLTLGGWFYVTGAANTYYMGKAVDGNGPYSLYHFNGGNAAAFKIRDSTDTTTYTVTTDRTLNVWQFIAGRYDPSTEIKVWVNATTNTNVAAIPAALLNGADDFAIGGLSGGTSLLTGRASLCFLCAAYVSDAIISSLYQQTRAAFGV